MRREEAQTIVDALTECIRTPYPLAQKRQILEADEPPPEGYEGDFTRDQEALREEQLVRRTVFMEFSRRLAAAESSKAGHKKSQHAVPPISPMWADLRFDFGSAPIFLPATATALSERRFRLRSLLRSSGFLRRNLPR